MRRIFPRRLLPFASALLFAAGSAQAQQLPVMGCRGAASCAGPRGFSTLFQSAGEGTPFFAVGLSFYDRKFRLRVVTPPSPYPDFRAIDASVALFVSRHPLRLPPPASPQEPAVETPEPELGGLLPG